MWLDEMKADFIGALGEIPDFELVDGLDFRQAHIRNGNVILGDVNFADLSLFFWFGELDRGHASFHIDLLDAIGQKTVVVNNAPSLRIALDKLVTQLHLSRHGIPVPDFFAVSRRNVEQIRRPLSQKPFLLKPRLGTFGIGITMITSFDQLVDIVDYSEAEAHFIEEFIESTPDDFIGINVVGGEIVSSYGKEPSKFSGWKVFDRDRRGGGMVKKNPSPEQAKIAIDVYRATNLDLFGVDIIKSLAGQNFVVDVNSFPGLYPTSSRTSRDMAQIFVDLIARKLGIRVTCA
jgi:glutathione synthase/RimK-type ligase-like ATP-grasp enzyme